MPEETIIPYTFKGQDLTGKKFNRLTVLGFVGRSKPGNTLLYWYKCQCDCGTVKIIEAFTLRYAGAKSCGCLRVERFLTHGGAKRGKREKLFSVWIHMKDRCLNNNCPCYDRYGGRGITVDERWMDYVNFREDMLPSYQDGLTLERKDNNGPYSKENCKWATTFEQARNTRGNRFVEFNGDRKLMVEWDEALNYPKGTTSHRLSNGWSVQKVLTTPIQGRKSI